jgi:hypothetical protein
MNMFNGPESPSISEELIENTDVDTLEEQQFDVREAEKRERFNKKHGLIPLVGALALNVAVAQHEKPAEAAEVMRGMKWQEGFAALKDDVYTAPAEQAAFAVVRTDGTVYWAGSKLGEKKKVRQNSSDVLATVEQELKSKTLKSFCSVHTHPVRSAEHAKMLNAQEADSIAEERTASFSVPPSGTDIDYFQWGNLGVSSEIKKSGGQVVHVVFDPSRVWRHRMATDVDRQKYPEFWKEVQGVREVFPHWKNHVKSRLTKLSETELDFFNTFASKKKGSKTEKTRLQTAEDKRRNIYFELLLGSNKELIAEVFRGDDEGRGLQERLNLHTERNKNERRMWNDIVYKQWIPASRKGEPSPELHAKLKEAYIRNGTVLESYAHNEVQDDPAKLCTWPQVESQ